MVVKFFQIKFTQKYSCMIFWHSFRSHENIKLALKRKFNDVSAIKV